MFKKRLLTTLVLVPLVLFAIFLTNQWVFASLILILLLGCSYEWSKLIPFNSCGLKVGYMVLVCAVAWFAQYEFNYWLIVNLVLWILIMLAEISFPRSQPIWGRPWLIAILGLIILSIFAQSLFALFLQHQGKELMIYLLCLVWATDIGAYLTGKKWGQTKLIPAVSPGKTIEGSLGGFILAMLVAVIGYFCFLPFLVINWFLIAIVCILISMAGDLSVSMLKRRVNLKDTGNLLPGHGGILDRMDSLIAALPFFYGGLILLAPGL